MQNPKQVSEVLLVPDVFVDEVSSDPNSFTTQELLVATAMPLVPSSFLLLVILPGATGSVLVPVP